MGCEKSADQCDVSFREIIKRETGTVDVHFGVASGNVICVLNLTFQGLQATIAKNLDADL